MEPSTVLYLSADYGWIESLFYQLLPTHDVAVPALLADGLSLTSVQQTPGTVPILPGDDFDGLYLVSDPAAGPATESLLGVVHEGSRREAPVMQSEGLARDWAAAHRRRFKAGWGIAEQAALSPTHFSQSRTAIANHVLRSVGSSYSRRPTGGRGSGIRFHNSGKTYLGYSRFDPTMARYAVGVATGEGVVIIDRLSNESWVDPTWNAEQLRPGLDLANALWWEYVSRPVLERAPLTGQVWMVPTALNGVESSSPGVGICHHRPNGQVALYAAGGWQSKLWPLRTLELGAPNGVRVHGREAVVERWSKPLEPDARFPTPDSDAALRYAQGVFARIAVGNWERLTAPPSTMAGLQDAMIDLVT